VGWPIGIRDELQIATRHMDRSWNEALAPLIQLSHVNEDHMLLTKKIHCLGSGQGFHLSSRFSEELFHPDIDHSIFFQIAGLEFGPRIV